MHVTMAVGCDYIYRDSLVAVMIRALTLDQSDVCWDFLLMVFIACDKLLLQKVWMEWTTSVVFSIL